ncbi:MAG TPA: SRPBCC domain-containing protein [Bacteroidia bacterium]|nr:SRPBCC domain-containing protein [Bacteroidia bacterium]
MEKLIFKITILAPVEHVYNTMLGIKNKNTYEAWTAIFNPTSTYDGTWEKGSKILFLGLDENGNKGGMVSKIDQIIQNEFVSILHYGILKNGKEVTSGEEVDKWTGGHENYTFTKLASGTELNVEIDAVDEFVDYFNETYPNALEKLREICEK